MTDLERRALLGDAEAQATALPQSLWSKTEIRCTENLFS